MDFAAPVIPSAGSIDHHHVGMKRLVDFNVGISPVGKLPLEQHATV
jgi:hypothetical protein